MVYEKRLTLLRLYVYGLHGLAAELIYTAFWHLVSDGNFKLQGYTSVYIFFIYAFEVSMIELLSPWLRLRFKLNWVIRGLIYMVWTYLWEFSTGRVLKHFDACPWDYEPWFSNHYMGLVTLEYAPFWFFGSLFAENVLVKFVLEFCDHLRQHHMFIEPHEKEI